MKKIILALTTILILSSLSYAEDINVVLDDFKLWFDVRPTIVDGRTLVPLRGIFESLNYDIEWNNETRTVTASQEGTVIILPVDESKALVNGEVYELDVPAKIIDGRTLVPVRFIAESTGHIVKWDKETRSVHIITETKTPTNFTAKDLYLNKFTLDWDTVEFADYYKIYQLDVASDEYIDVLNKENENKWYSLNGYNAEITYYDFQTDLTYKVTAVIGDKESDLSEPLVYTSKDKPSDKDFERAFEDFEMGFVHEDIKISFDFAICSDDRKVTNINIYIDEYTLKDFEEKILINDRLKNEFNNHMLSIASNMQKIFREQIFLIVAMTTESAIYPEEYKVNSIDKNPIIEESEDSFYVYYPIYQVNYYKESNAKVKILEKN